MHITSGVLIDRLQRALGKVGSRVLLVTDQVAAKDAKPPVAVPGMNPATRLAPNVWGYGAGSVLMLCGGDYTLFALPLRDRTFDVLFDFSLPGLNAHCDYRVEWPSNTASVRVCVECSTTVNASETFRMRHVTQAHPDLPLAHACGIASGHLMSSPAAKWMVEGGARAVMLVDVLGTRAMISLPSFAPKISHAGKTFMLNVSVSGSPTYYETR